MFSDINLDPVFSFAADSDCNNLELHFLESYFNLSDRERKAFCEILLKMFPNAFSDVQNPLEKVWKEAPPVFECAEPAEVPTSPDDVEELVQKGSEMIREQAISEKKPDAPASSANGSAVG